jgi:Tetratricopeptide repeat
MANLASTYRDQGRWKEAEELFMQVMETSKRVLGQKHPDTLTSMANGIKDDGKRPAQLNLYELASSNRNAAYSQQDPGVSVNI